MLNPNPWLVRIFIITAGIALILNSIRIAIGSFQDQEPIDPTYSKVEALKRLGELHLVKQYYESIIPILKDKGDKKDPKLQFLLIAPVEVTGYLDFSEIVVEIKKDSLLSIYIPPAQISEVYLDFKKTKEYVAEGKFRLFGKVIEKINHQEAYYDIAEGIAENKEKVKDRAAANNIVGETSLRAQLFLRNFLQTLGYRINFVQEAELNDSQEEPNPKS